MRQFLDNVVYILKFLLVIVVLFFTVWLSITGRFNIGALIKKFLGEEDKDVKYPKIVDEKGNISGVVVEIVKNNNPIRDKSVLILTDGTKVKLPDGVIDSDVKSILMIKPGVYSVAINHNIFTSVFD